MMSMCQTICQTQELALTGGVTDTIFPELEELLDDSTELQDALIHLAPKRQMDQFESVMDFIFCSVHPQFKKACLAFYEGREKPLRNMIDDLERLESLYRMLWAMNEAHKALDNHRHRVWGWVEIVRKASLIRLEEAERIRSWVA